MGRRMWPKTRFYIKWIARAVSLATGASLSSRLVVDRLGVHVKTIQRWVCEGRLPDYRLGNEQRLWLYPDDIEALLTPLR